MCMPHPARLFVLVSGAIWRAVYFKTHKSPVKNTQPRELIYYCVYTKVFHQQVWEQPRCNTSSPRCQVDSQEVT